MKKCIAESCAQEAANRACSGVVAVACAVAAAGRLVWILWHSYFWLCEFRFCNGRLGLLVGCFRGNAIAGARLRSRSWFAGACRSACGNALNPRAELR